MVGGRWMIGSLRNIEKRVCDRHFDHMINCLPDVKAASIMRGLYWLIDSTGEESAVVV